MKNFITLFLLAVIPILPATSACARESGAPMSVEGATSVTTKEAKELFDEGILFVDTRENSAWELGRIPGAVHIDVRTNAFTKEALMEEAKLEDKVLFYCNGIKCGRSSTASMKAVKYGYTHVYYYREGYPGWKNAGYPVE